VVKVAANDQIRAQSDLANVLFSELLMADQLARNRLSKVLPQRDGAVAFRRAEPVGARSGRTQPR
jgi:hypothetical protein